MSALDRLTSNLRETVDQLAEGWQELWQKARNAITRFTPQDRTDTHPLNVSGSHWGVMSAELRETDDRIEILLEAPGMEPGDFNIQVDKQALLVRGSKHYASDRKEGRYHITERAYGSFERVIPLPCPVDEASATAHYKKGVLEINLTKHPSLQPRRIKVS